jgi:hypothetical protein
MAVLIRRVSSCREMKFREADLMEVGDGAACIREKEWFLGLKFSLILSDRIVMVKDRSLAEF